MADAHLTTQDVPRLVEQLLAQIQSETRRPLSPSIVSLSNKIEVASATAPKIHIIRGDWDRWELTTTEAHIASMLKAAGGNSVAREQIMASLYGDDRPEQKILDVLVCKLNKKLAGYYRVQNDWGFGYRLVYLRRGRDPRDVIEWRGIFMGVKQALVAERLFTAMNTWTHTRDIAKAANSKPNAVGSIMRLLKKNLLATPYHIENVRSAGYRMVIKRNAQRAA